MKTFKNLSIFGAAFLMAASMGSVYAEEGDMTQTRTQERTRTEFNLQTPTADFGQSRNREEHMVTNENQYQYKYMNNLQSEGDTSARVMNRVNTMNRSMQGSSMTGSTTGSMTQQNTAVRSMGGSRR